MSRHKLGEAFKHQMELENDFTLEKINNNRKETLPHFRCSSCLCVLENTKEKGTFKSGGISHCCDKYLSQERKDSSIFSHMEQIKAPRVQNFICLQHACVIIRSGKL